MVSQTAEYALRAVLCLADRPGEAMTTQRIAQAARISPAYLSKVLHLLCLAGVVRSRRGLHGGYTFARSVEQVNVLDIVNAVSPLRRLEGGALRRDSIPAVSSAAVEHLNGLIDWVEHYLASTTVRDLLGCQGHQTPPAEAGTPSDCARHHVNADVYGENRAGDRLLIRERAES